MPRFPRSYIKTSFFHVITQGINKSYIFEKPDDIKFYIKIMHNLMDQHDVKIISYCIMNNHAHMLIETNTLSSLSKYMQRLNATYGMYFNKKYNRVGYVFRDRYKAEGIYGEQHLYNCIKYIYNNPVKAGICSKASDYPYSNYKKIDASTDIHYAFIDIDPIENCNNIIQNFLIENKIDLVGLQNDKRKMREIVITLKQEYNISLRKISQLIGVNRETIRKIYNS